MDKQNELPRSEPEKQEPPPGIAGPTAPAPADDETSNSVSEGEVEDDNKGGYGAD